MDDDQFDSFVQYVRMCLRRNEPFLDSTAAQGRARGYLLVDRPRDGGEDFLARLVEESQSDKASWDALNLIAQEMIRTGEALPEKLAKWTADVLADQSAKRGHESRPRPGQGGHATAGRDWNIYFLIDRLHTKWNVKPTRNDASPPVSACDIVAAATELPYGTVARAWDRCSHQMRKA